MTQILYMLVDKVNSDPYADAMCYKAGDVISVREDDDAPYEKDPGIIERLGTMFAVVHVDGPASDYISYAAPEIGDRKLNRMLQRRAFKMTVSTVDGKTVVTKVQKLARVDPNVIGGDPNVIEP